MTEKYHIMYYGGIKAKSKEPGLYQFPKIVIDGQKKRPIVLHFVFQAKIKPNVNLIIEETNEIVKALQFVALPN